jgi:hypothetical protein
MVFPNTISIAEANASAIARISSCGGSMAGCVLPFYAGQPTDVFGDTRINMAPRMNLNVSTLKDVFLLVGPGRDGVVFDADGRLISETKCHADISLHGYTLDRLRRDASYIDDPLFQVFDPSWRNYYHWTVVGLGRAMLYNRYCANGHATIVFDRIGRDATGWGVGFDYDVWRESLRRSRVCENCLFLKTGIYKVRTLDVMWMSNEVDQVVDQPPYIGYFSELYTGFRDIVSGGRDIGCRNFIISRPHDPRMTPEGSEALGLLVKNGDFEFVTLEGLRFDDQFNLFASAKTIVAPHGAGLTNIVYTPRSATIIELNRRVNGERTLRPWFYLMAATIGQPYRFVDLDGFKDDSGALFDGLTKAWTS